MIAGYGSVAVLITIQRSLCREKLLNEAFRFRIIDKLLAIDDAAQKQPDNHQHNGDFNERKSGFEAIFRLNGKCHGAAPIKEPSFAVGVKRAIHLDIFLVRTGLVPQRV